MNVDRHPVNVLSLCSGAGGLDLGVRMALPTARTVCYVEIEAYAAEVLACRMEESRLDAAPVWTDLRTFDGRPWRGVVDLVVGGYPCQPFSLAGSRLGADDPRHLWPHIARILRELGRPAAFLENVSGHVSLGLRAVRAELEGMGYRVEAEIVRAEEIGAPHRRERVFILAHADGGRFKGERRSWLSDGERKAHRDDADGRGGQDVGDADGARLERRSVRGFSGADQRLTWPPGPSDVARWQAWDGPEPAICRDADGLANRVDELRICGGGVVPQQAAYAFNLIRQRLT